MTAPAVVEVPLARLTPAPWNPRMIRDDRFQNLCASIQADPEFLWRRPILAMADGTIYAGNMRYRAAEHLGLRTVPAIVEDVSEQLAKERALRDNAQWGDWEEAALGDVLRELEAVDSDLAILGLSDAELAWLLGSPQSEQSGFERPKDRRDIGNRFLVRVVLTPVGVELLEAALSATGLSNRAAAMAAILEDYLATKGQLHIPSQDQLAAAVAAESQI